MESNMQAFDLEIKKSRWWKARYNRPSRPIRPHVVWEGVWEEGGCGWGEEQSFNQLSCQPIYHAINRSIKTQAIKSNQPNQPNAQPINHLLMSAVEIICWDQLAKSSVEIIYWHYLVNNCWSICWYQLVRISVELNYWNDLLRLSVEIICWDQLLR